MNKTEQEDFGMFTYVKLKNYKSLVDLNVNFLQKKKTPKNAVFVYGENGVGKSNFASAFLTLYESMRTLSIRKAVQSFLEAKDETGNKEDLLKAIQEKLRDTEAIIRNCKTIASTENMVLEFGFILDGKEGSYYLEYDNEKLVREKLEYVLNRNRIVFYDIGEVTTNINKNIFLESEFYNEIKLLVEQYKGKHSLLSIIVNEKEEKAQDYIVERVHESLYNLIFSFITMSVKVKTGNHGEMVKVGLSHPILAKLERGSIDIAEVEELDKAEELVNDFFTRTYGDIKSAYYKREVNEGKINYELYFSKLIYNKLIDVSFELESSGTQHLLDILPFVLMCVEGTIVIIDEVDTGIHDLLVDNILENVVSSIRGHQGQLILTTHNTMILDSDISPQYIYTFVEDDQANKQLVSIVDFEERTHPHLNYRDRYLKGMYGGVPLLGELDFEELRELLD
jgi:AAA15 family ATPase/GTPase